MKNITGVFEGGGIRGIALAGAAAATLDLGYEFKRSVGTSAGAIVSSLVAAGYSSTELREAVIGVDWPSLLPDKTALSKNMSMLMRLGFYSSSPLERLLHQMLEAKGVRTFADLPDNALAVVATDLNHGRGLVLGGGPTRSRPRRRGLLGSGGGAHVGVGSIRLRAREADRPDQWRGTAHG